MRLDYELLSAFGVSILGFCAYTVLLVALEAAIKAILTPRVEHNMEKQDESDIKTHNASNLSIYQFLNIFTFLFVFV